MKKAFTLIEIIIAMAILGIIMVAVQNVFVTGIKNYRVNSQRSSFQKEVNFMLDDITGNIKTATLVEQFYPAATPVYYSGTNILILALPATDSSGNFINAATEKDYYVYQLTGQSLHRRTFTSPLGVKAAQNNQDVVLSENVSALNFTYDPAVNSSPSKVTANITLSVPIGNRTVSVNANRFAYLRNKQ